MKKLNKLLIAVIMVLTALGASAQEFSVGDLTYKIYSPNAWCTGLTAAAKGKSNLAVVIPSKVTYNGTTYRVNGIDANSFKNATNITSVEMRFGVGTIENNVFEGCTGITYVRLPSSLKTVFADAFKGCTALKWVYYAGFSFPQGNMYSNSFPSNSGMTLCISTQSKKTPAQYKSQTGFTQFATVEYSRYAYDEYMSDGGMYAMGWPDNNGPDVTRSATLMGYNTNGSQTSGGTIYKPTAAVYNPNGGGISFSIDTIGSNAFEGQTSLKTIDLTNATKVKYIDQQSTNTGVQNVTKLVLPPSNFNFNTATFIGFTSLTAFELASGSSSFAIYDGSLYNYSKTTLWRVPLAKSGTMSYPSTLTRVWTFSHSNCTKITSAILPYGVKTVESYAFRGCSALSSIRIPSSVTSLSNSYVFNGINTSAYVYVNMQNPPTITADNYFGTHSNIDLYVPYGRESAYSSAGWTGFYGVNRDAQALDYYPSSDGPGYTVTSTTSFTANDGVTYDGRVKTVAYGAAKNSSATTVVVPAYMLMNGKKYAVTKIGEKSFAYKSTSTNYTVTGCVNVDTVGYGAFQNQPVTSFPFTHHMTYIQDYAFDGAGLTGTISLPYGIKKLDYYAFGHGKYERIIVPSSLSSHYGNWCTGTTTLKEIVWNCRWGWGYSNWNFDGVPSNCYIRVPTGVVNQFKQDSKFSSRASYITAGAYDFAYYNNYTSNYFLTITSTSSTTYNGTTYAGKAKYVYHPNIQNSTSGGNYGFATYEEDRTVSGDYRKYLITEIGDSLLYGSQYTGGNIPAAVTRIGQSAFRDCAYGVNNLVLPSGLTFIGHDAFYNSAITGEVKVPASVTKLEDWALCASTLGSLYFPDMPLPTMGTTVWSESIGKVWVPNHRANDYMTKSSAWGSKWPAKINVYIKPNATTQMFSSVVPVNMSGSNINAYYASNYDKNQTGKEVTLTKANQAPENTGLLLVDLTVNQEYRISRPTGSVSAPMTNYFIGNPSSTVNVNAQTVGYYWNPDSKKFIDPTTTFNLTAGMAYLKLSSSEASGKSEVYTNLYPKSNQGLAGDCDGNGVIDINDVNIAINVMLGKDTNPAHVAAANANGQGGVDIADVNLIINKMLGK